ncbi:hypothetical protein R1sor_006872 [Riccia sorocarpa]|uniref:Histone deacetylase domain-containing protein n=1 Tax=Riccia sorocarpa TaxID=122646 RepID=A0ABD3HSX2_9MARC
MDQSTSSSSGASEGEKESQRARIKKSQLYKQNVGADKVPLIYSSQYNIGFMGLEKLHPFDSGKWGRIRDFLVNEKVLKKESIVEPKEATDDDLLVVHTPQYLKSLESSLTVANIVEVGGTILAGKLAKERSWAINLGGGFHHCSGTQGGGFCVYADITLCIQFAFSELGISKVMIIDLDAHQGNGHERDFMDDDRVYILDMYNSQIYPFDQGAKRRINQKVELKIAKDAYKPELILYNAGTDILDGDPLGRLRISPAGIVERDEEVFKFAREVEAPIVMVTSGEFLYVYRGTSFKLYTALLATRYSCRGLRRQCITGAERSGWIEKDLHFNRSSQAEEAEIMEYYQHDGEADLCTQNVGFSSSLEKCLVSVYIFLIESVGLFTLYPSLGWSRMAASVVSWKIKDRDYGSLERQRFEISLKLTCIGPLSVTSAAFT